MLQRLSAAVTSGLFLVLWCLAAQGQQLRTDTDAGGDFVHYSYATLLGTGIYKLDDRTISIFRIPISWTFREPTRDKFGIKLRVPTAVGFHNFDLLDDLLPDSDQLSTLSVMPGIELQYLIGENWRVAPAAYLGFGTDLTSSASSIIYGASISALRPLKFAYPEMDFGTAVILSGYDPRNVNGDFVTRWSVGVDAKFPTTWRFADRDIFIGGHAIGYYYLNRVEFQSIVDESIKLRGELEFGIFLGARPAPKILGITFDRLGVGYRFSHVSDAIIFFAGFPF